MVLTYPNIYMQITTDVLKLLFDVKTLSLYIPVMIFNKLWNATIAEILPVGRETLNTNKV